jgi:CheY-like chemotaxis protein
MFFSHICLARSSGMEECFPMHLDAPSQAETKRMVDAPNDMDSSLILVVDDDPSIRDLLRLILEMDGFKIETASHGREALELLQRIPRPNMILLDLMMPIMDGWQFHAALKEDPVLRDIPVVVITAYSRHEIEMPSTEILPKPIEFSRLRELTLKYCPNAKLNLDCG